jgi:hypothetical protein
VAEKKAPVGASADTLSSILLVYDTDMALLLIALSGGELQG